MTKRRALWAVGVAAGLYLFLSARHLELPGLFRDEAAAPLFAARALAGKAALPLMHCAYSGAPVTAWYLPFFSALGPTAVATRLANVLLGLGILLAACSCAWLMFGPAAAAVSGLFLAVDPTFLFVLRDDWAATGMPVLLQTLSLLFFLAYSASNKLSRLAAASLLTGLAFWARADSFWFYAGLIPAVVLWKGREVRALRAHGLRLLLLPIAFLAGSGPFLASFASDPRAFRRFLSTDVHHAPTFGYAASLLAHAGLVWSGLQGSAIAMHMLSVPGPLTMTAGLWAGALGYALWNRPANPAGLLRNAENLPFLATASALSGLACVLTPPVYSVHHVVHALFPLAHVLAAAALVSLWSGGRSWLVAGAIALQAAASLRADAFIDRRIRENLVSPGYSRTFYAIADYLSKESPDRVVDLDFGWDDSMEFLTGLKIERCDSVARGRDSDGYWRALLAGRNLYLMHPGPVGDPQSGPVFLEKMRRMGRRPILRRRFFLRKDGDLNAAVDVYAVAADDRR